MLCKFLHEAESSSTSSVAVPQPSESIKNQQQTLRERALQSMKVKPQSSSAVLITDRTIEVKGGGGEGLEKAITEDAIDDFLLQQR